MLFTYVQYKLPRICILNCRKQLCAIFMHNSMTAKKLILVKKIIKFIPIKDLFFKNKIKNIIK